MPSDGNLKKRIPRYTELCMTRLWKACVILIPSGSMGMVNILGT